ncbi:MAG: transposase [Oscillospiraceae bacterium]|nr:transposase [Oscillospiraceae bacterium]
MPNHIHLLLRVEKNEQARTIPRIIQQTKGSVTKQIGSNIWQSRFYDHIIRDENDYLIRAKYIADNPAKWAQDDYYAAEQP